MASGILSVLYARLGDKHTVRLRQIVKPSFWRFFSECSNNPYFATGLEQCYKQLFGFGGVEQTDNGLKL
jgi:hypothetical protein